MEWKLSTGVLEKLNFNSLSPNKIILQDPVIDELTKQDTMSDVKYQNITYYMHNHNKTVESKDKIQIDFLNGMSEMYDLDWKYKMNYIGYENQGTNDCVQFIRQGEDKWYAEVLIRSGKDWDGYTWSCYSNSEKIVSMMRLFFEDVPWFGMLSWKMRRYRT